MSLELNPNEQELYAEIVECIDKVRKAFASFDFNQEAQSWVAEAGEKAHRLHMLLLDRGHEPKHHKYMIENRDMRPDNPKFYLHLHPIEDLLAFIKDEHANDDPIDSTIDAEFTFRVFSKRWGHDDTYHVKRITDGWSIEHIAINGTCDKGGHPFLFENLHQDYIRYPMDLDDWLESLWDLASVKGLSHEQVQTGLQQLADWVSTTEKSRPTGGIWEGR